VLAGRFRITSPFLICRFSTLYHGVDLGGEVPVVIRLLRLPPAGDEKRRQDIRVQIEREGAVLAQLSHPNLPAVYEVGHHGPHTFLVLEHFEGHTLDVFLKHMGSLDVPYVRRLLGQFLDVLGYLHRQSPPIIHRDLRPHSVVMSHEGILKIAEFGLARITEPGRDEAVSTLFKSEGNSNYAAPEQLLRVGSAPANDIYALGAVMYFLLTQEHPPKSLDRATGDARMRTIGASRNDVPPALEKVVLRMMEPARARRFSTVEEVLAEMQTAFPEGAE
jgi:serine/threonine-protein kinase